MRTSFNIESPDQLFSFTRRRFALSLFYVQLLCSPTALAQRTHTSFGLFSDYQLDFRPSGFAVGPPESGTTELVVIAANQPAIHFFEMSGPQRVKRTSTMTAQTTFRHIAAADMNRDTNIDYVALAEDGWSLSIFTRLPKKGWTESRIHLAAPAERFVIADINNDRRNDILLFGRISGGVSTLLGRASGTWKPGPVLFPEISASDVTVTDINGDGVADLLVLNWLSNQLIAYYGISQMVYTEQVAVQLDADPAELTITPVSEERTFLAAITCPEDKKIVVYSGNSLGDYRLTGTLPIGEKPWGVQFADVDGDGEADIITSSRLGIHVSFGTPAAFTKPTVFGCARSDVVWHVTDMDRDGKADCVFVERGSNRLAFLLNAESDSKLARSIAADPTVEYAVGTSPHGLVVADLNGDGRVDVAVANVESSSLSLLLNKGRGKLAGQIALPVGERPYHLRFVLSGRGRKVLVASHRADDMISVVELGEEPEESVPLSVPTGNEPYVVHASEDSARLKFVVRYKAQRNRTYLFSLFEQVSSEKFIEQSLRTTSATPIVALTVNPSGSLGSYDFVYATHNDKTKQTTIWHSVSAAGISFPPPAELFSFPDSSASTRIVLHNYVNKDGRKDVVVVMGAPQNRLGIWYNNGTDTPTDSIEWIRNVQPVDEDAVLIKDVNDDEQTDLLWIDGIRKTVVVLYGSERRGPRQPVDLVPAEGARSLRVGSMRDVRVNDLILSHPDRGTVSLIMNPFQR